jgi:hypothetical protein
MLVAQSVAANGGIISPIYTPTVLYRQHNNNVVGAHERNKAFYIKKIKSLNQTIRNNYHDWFLSQHIRRYSFASYLWTKVRIIIWKIMKYK